MDQSKSLFFIALLPPQEVQAYANEVKQYFANIYQSQHAQTSPPHITLQPPFEWQIDQVPLLKKSLLDFVQTRTAVPITLKGFGTFPPRVIYINVLKTPDLLAIQKDLMHYLEKTFSITVNQLTKNRPFNPHLTVAYKDLTKQNFYKSWQEFEHRELDFEFMVSNLTLLRHDGQRWNVILELPFSKEIPVPQN